MVYLHSRFGRWLGTVGLAVLALSARPAAAQVATYTFNAQFNQPYTPLTGTVFSPSAGAGDLDDGYSAQLPIGFGFPYNGATYTTAFLNTNGWLGFGAGSTLPFNGVLNFTVDNLVAFFGKDLDASRGVFSYVTTGSSPNRIFQIQCTGISQPSLPTASGNVQIWLRESGQIEFHYGTFTNAFTTVFSTPPGVGLRGTGTTDVRSVTGTWAVPVASNSSTASMPLDATNFPLSGSIFTFAPAAGADVVPPTITSVTLSPAGGACTAVAHTVTVQASDASGIASVVVNYSVSGGATQSVTSTSSGGSYTATIPAQGSASVTYSVTVTDASSAANTTTSASATYADAPTTISAGSDQTINVGQTATLTATAPLAGGIKITEVTLLRSGTGATPTMPAYVGSSDDDFVEISNTNAGAFNLAGYMLEVQAGGGTGAARTFTFPASAVIPGQTVTLLHLGTGTDSPANFYYHTGGSNDPFFSGSDLGLVLRAPGGTTVVDAVAVNTWTLTGMAVADWSGTGASSPSGVAGASLHGADTNTSANWQAASASTPQSLGTLNTGLAAAPTPSVTWTGGLFTAPVTSNPVTTPAHTTAGAYTYTATYTANGCTVSNQVMVTVVGAVAPVAAFMASATSVSQTDVVTFTDQSTNLPTAWDWTFSPNTVTFVNGTSATSQNPQVTFTAAGQYTVTLTASNAAGSDAEVKPNYITVALAYCATNLQSSPCNIGGGTINGVVIVGTTLSNTNTGCNQLSGTAYSVWPASGTTTTTLTAGQTYQLTLTSSSSGSIVAWLDLDANGVFDASEFINVSQGGTANTPLTASFTVPASAPAGQVRLRVRNGTSANSITATDACVLRFTGETEDYTVTIRGGCPVPTPAITSNSPVCAGTTLTLAVTNAPTGATVAWTGPNGFTATGASVTDVTPATGSYTATVTLNCSVSAAVSVSVTPRATAAFSYAVSSYCLTATTNLTPTVAGTTGGTFSVTPTGLTVNAATGVLNLSSSQAGTYTVTYTAGTVCPATATQTLTITAPGNAAFTYATTQACTSITTALTPTASAGATLGTFSTIPVTGLTINPATGAIDPSTSTPGQYYVLNTLAPNGVCGAVTVRDTVTIVATPATPTVTTTPNPDGTTTLTSSAASGNQWYLNGTAVPGAIGQTYIVNAVAQNGAYTVQASNGDCLSGLSAPVTVTVTGIAEAPDASLDVQLYPNPTTTDGQTTVALRGYHTTVVTLRFFDAVGRLVLMVPVAAARPEQPLDLRPLPTGTYLLRVTAPGHVPVLRRVVRD